MITVQKSVHINRPTAGVWAFLTDWSNDSKWQADVVRSEQTSPGPLALGSTGLAVQKFMGRELKNDVVVTVFEPMRRYGFKTTSGPVQFEGITTFEEMGGGTHVTFDFKGEPGGFFKLAEGLVKKELEKSLDRDLAKLKQVLES